MKKVLIDYLGRNNAGPVFTIEIARSMAKNGYEVFVLISKQTVNRTEWECDSFFKEIYEVDTYSSNIEFLVNTTRLFVSGKKKIVEHYKKKQIKFDYIIRPFYHPWAVFLDNTIAYEKVVTFCHDPISHYGANKLRSSLFGKFMKQSDIVVVLTKSFTEVVEKKYGIDKKNIIFMPHGIIKMYKNKQMKQDSTLYSKDKINFMFFGRIEKYKGIGVLLKAFNMLCEKYQNVSLTIAGKGQTEEFEDLMKNLPNFKLMNRFIEDEEVGMLFDGPNVITVMPYLDATQSGIIPLALEYKTPVIATDTGGIREQLLDGKFGLIAKPGDEKSLYLEMKKIVDDKNIITEQKKIMKEVSEEMDWDVILNKFCQELEGKCDVQ
ncbi:MAG: hypothetical protein RHS_1004 [Robinsoniella sp. RHS]|uniref:glycosyltransferase family 4 protein n=1 Tax=Robinsoniella sp. RHS TaxID=1504536 RepID=UPI000649B476|nr:MAG: hypothetical protein RHS_1004 [Robinsoniella sp. RHS]